MFHTASTRSSILGACFDLYSTLIHENPENPFYGNVAEDLDLDLAKWLPAYRMRGPDCMTGRIAGMSERVRIAGEDCGYSHSPELVKAVVARHFSKFIDSVTLDPDSTSLLGFLQDNDIRLALISNASEYSEEILNRLGLRPFFNSVVLSYRIGVLKPDSAIYRIALDNLSLPANACVFVGDGGDRELTGARRVGMQTVLVDRSLSHSERARIDADIIVSNLRDVRNIIRTPCAYSVHGTGKRKRR